MHVCHVAAKQEPQGSLLTDEEQDAQYRAVVQQARANANVSSGVNSVCSAYAVARDAGHKGHMTLTFQPAESDSWCHCTACHACTGIGIKRYP